MDPTMLMSMAMMRQGGDASTYIMILVILFPIISKYIIKYIKKQKKTCVRLVQTFNFKNGACVEVFCTPKYSAVNHFVVTFLANNPNIPHEVLYADLIKNNQVIMNGFTYKNITIRQEIDEVQDSSEKNDSFKSKDYVYVITSSDNNMKTINNFIDTCEEDYTSFTSKISNRCYILYMNSVYKSVPFYTTKSFDNMFFSQKKDLITCIDNFTNNEDEYKRLGIPYTLGLMFHGSPGCGKTSAIKAIARHTKRTILMIPANKIKTVEHLHSIFESEFINAHTIPIRKRLYVFEEIDCGAWKDLVQSREFRKKTEENHICEKNQETLMHTMIQVAMNKKKEEHTVKEEETEAITLGDLLEVLDGIIETSGRMIIMTSNHPERLDPALLRPGRIDKIIEFKKMTKADIISMYKLWFQVDMPSDVQEALKDYTFSQADIGNIFASRDLHIIHKKLRSG